MPPLNCRSLAIMAGVVPPGGGGGDDMMRQAQHIWTMLDDMVDKNPQAYRAFIDKHLKEGKEAMRPPQPHMCVSTKIQV